MSLALSARLARRELRGGLRGFRIFLACVILGVAAIVAVGTVRESIQAGLSRDGAILLGGDAALELTYRFASEEERAWMEGVAEAVSEIVDFRSLALVDETRMLTQVKAVDDAYPLKGTVTLDPPMPLSAALETRDLPGAVMDPVLSAQLNIEPGDTFKLGTQAFELRAALIDEPDVAAAGFGLGPRSIVRRAALAESGLLEAGTLFSTQYRLALSTDSDLDALQAEVRTRFAGSGITWQDARNGAPAVAQFVDRLGVFLILVGLSGLAVGGVGISAALRAYLATKTRTIATLRTLGANRRVIFQTYFMQVGVLALLGMALGTVLGVGLPVALAPLIEARLPVPAVFGVYPAPILEALIYSTLAVLIFTLWPLARAEEVRASTLFRDALSDTDAWPAPRYLLAMALLLLGLLGAATLFSGNLTLTLWTAGGIIGSLGLLALAAYGLRLLARRLRRVTRRQPALSWALGAIGGPGTTAGPVMLSLGLGLSVLAAVAQVDGNLRGAIARDLPERAPSYFFVDLQRDQMPGFLERMDSDPAVSAVEQAPMLRGIITRINDRPAEEVVGSHWVLEGDRGVSYAGALPETTELTSGTWWGEDYAGPPQVSFSAGEAEEMGLALGDRITVNILGRDITAELTSLREVDFSTAGMAFIMVMNPAALEAAPHSFIATVYAEEAAEAAILRDVAAAFPNVTAIRVRDAISRVSDLLGGLAAAISWGASVTLLTGFLVLIGAAAADQSARRYEAAVLKTLGATRGRILLSLVLRAVILGAAAGAVALCAGLLGGWAVSHYIMETGFEPIWSSAFFIIGTGILVTLLAGIAFAWGPLTARPAAILRARE
jgi:putative ABC transport system permease protein